MIKIEKVIFAGAVITIVAFLYVHLHAEIYKAGYALQRERQKLAYLVDDNSDLTYRLSVMETPRYLLASLRGQDAEFSGHRREVGRSYLMAGISGPERGYSVERPESLMDTIIPFAQAEDRI